MSSFSLGERSANTSSTPMTAPTVSATSLRSPVTIAMRVIPDFRNERRVRAASGRSGSSKTRTAAGSSSMPTNTVRAPSSAALRRADRAQVGAPVIPVHDALPTATRWPDTVPRMPWPDISSTLSGRQSSYFCSSADCTTALARTWGETWSRDAASWRTCLAGHDSSAHTISVRTGCPTVIVPVLSISRVVQVAMRSRTAPPLTITPRLAARERPETIATGAAKIKGHGVATTRTATARLAPPANQAIPATSRVPARKTSA